MSKKRIKRACIISGNGSWCAYGGGTLSRLNHNYDTVVGISTGSLMTPFVALKEWEYLKLKFTSLTNKDVYDRHFLRPNYLIRNGKLNKLIVLHSLLLNRKTIKTTKRFENFINELFTENYYEEIQHHSKEILISVQNYNSKPSRVHFFNGFYESYEDLKDWIWFSTNTPFFQSLGKKGWKDKNGKFHVGQWSGGNFCEMLALDELAGNKFTDIDIILNRPKIVEKFEGNRIKNLTDYIFTALDSVREVMDDKCLVDKIRDINKEGVNVNIYWLPRELTISPLSFKPQKLLDWWEEGYITALDENRLDIYPAKEKW